MSNVVRTFGCLLLLLGAVSGCASSSAEKVQRRIAPEPSVEADERARTRRRAATTGEVVRVVRYAGLTEYSVEFHDGVPPPAGAMLAVFRGDHEVGALVVTHSGARRRTPVLVERDGEPPTIVHAELVRPLRDRDSVWVVLDDGSVARGRVVDFGYGTGTTVRRPAWDGDEPIVEGDRVDVRGISLETLGEVLRPRYLE